mgnify:CR=1 FL=1
MSFGFLLFGMISLKKDVSVEHVRRAAGMLTWFCIDLISKYNLVTASAAAESLLTLFKHSKGDKGRSVVKRILCVAIYNMLWPVAEAKWSTAQDYSRWFALLIDLHSTVLAWAVKKKNDWLVALPTLTALICASPRENFTMNFSAIRHTLVQAYGHPGSCVTALRCAQRVVFVYLSKVCDRMETTVNALSLILTDILTAAQTQTFSLQMMANTATGSGGSGAGSAAGAGSNNADALLLESEGKSTAFGAGVDASHSLASLNTTGAAGAGSGSGDDVNGGAFGAGGVMRGGGTASAAKVRSTARGTSLYNNNDLALYILLWINEAALFLLYFV